MASFSGGIQLPSPDSGAAVLHEQSAGYVFFDGYLGSGWDESDGSSAYRAGTWYSVAPYSATEFVSSIILDVDANSGYLYLRRSPDAVGEAGATGDIEVFLTIEAGPQADI
jgi:hypothetical protein